MDEGTGRVRPDGLDGYVESLRARMPAGQFIVLMRAFNAWLTGGGLPAHPHPDAGEPEPLGPELQGEMLTLMGLACRPLAAGEVRPAR